MECIDTNFRKMKDILPEKPSELISLALKDLESCVIQGYQVDMGHWYVRESVEQCSVCLGGSVIAQTLGINEVGYTGPNIGNFTPTMCKKLRALNLFRCGYLESGLKCLGSELPKDLKPNYAVASYQQNPIQFTKDMRLMAGRLAEQKL